MSIIDNDIDSESSSRDQSLANPAEVGCSEASSCSLPSSLGGHVSRSCSDPLGDESTEGEHASLSNSMFNSPFTIISQTTRATPKRRMTKREKLEARARARRWSQNRQRKSIHHVECTKESSITENKRSESNVSNEEIYLQNHHSLVGSRNNTAGSQSQSTEEESTTLVQSVIVCASSLWKSIKNKDWERPITFNLPLWGVLLISIFLVTVLLGSMMLLAISMLLLGMTLGGSECLM